LSWIIYGDVDGEEADEAVRHHHPFQLTTDLDNDSAARLPAVIAILAAQGVAMRRSAEVDESWEDVDRRGGKEKGLWCS
jgi:hypothetical protein